MLGLKNQVPSIRKGVLFRWKKLQGSVLKLRELLDLGENLWRLSRWLGFHFKTHWSGSSVVCDWERADVILWSSSGWMWSLRERTNSWRRYCKKQLKEGQTMWGYAGETGWEQRSAGRKPSEQTGSVPNPGSKLLRGREKRKERGSVSKEEP